MVDAPFEFFVDPEWLERVRGLDFFYPAAGTDIAQPVKVFAPVMARIVMNDYRSCSGFNDWKSLARKLRWFLQSDNTFTHSSYDCVVEITRAYGQELLGTKFEDGKLGVFFHRCDSPGEGGSNLDFWHERSCEPVFGPHIIDLRAILLRKLAPNALVVTDGSLMPYRNNWNIEPENWDFVHVKEKRAREAFEESQGEVYEAAGLRWQAVGWLSDSRRQAVCWGVHR